MLLPHQDSEITAGRVFSRSRYEESGCFDSSVDLNISLSVPVSVERDIKLFHEVTEQADKCF